MGLTWNLSALISTIALVLISLAIWNKMKTKQDSPLYRIMEKFKRKKSEEEIYDESKYYRKISHRSGLKW